MGDMYFQHSTLPPFHLLLFLPSPPLPPSLSFPPILLSVGGAVMVGLSHSQSNEEGPSSGFNTGALYALGGAVL